MTPESEPDYEYEQDLQDQIRALQAALDAERASHSDSYYCAELHKCSRVVDSLKIQLAEARSALQACQQQLNISLGALADISTNDDMNRQQQRAKAKRIYEELAAPSPARPQEERAKNLQSE